MRLNYSRGCPAQALLGRVCYSSQIPTRPETTLSWPPLVRAQDAPKTKRARAPRATRATFLPTNQASGPYLPPSPVRLPNTASRTMHMFSLDKRLTWRSATRKLSRRLAASPLRRWSLVWIARRAHSNRQLHALVLLDKPVCISVAELCAVNYFSACSVFPCRLRSMFLIRRDLLINLLVGEQPYKGLLDRRLIPSFKSMKPS
jgi:hypothetical protein